MAGDTHQLEAGRVGRAHGLDGSFYVTRARPHLLALGATVTIAGRTAKIVRRAGADRRPIVRLADITDRTGAEAVHGQPLTVAARDAPALAEGEYWTHELEGCMVLDGSRQIGTVVRVIELPSCEALEVQALPADQPLLIPMVKDAIRSVDVDGARIEVNMDFIES